MLMILGQIAGGLYMVGLENSNQSKFELFQLHKSFGLTVLFLTFLRIAWRLTHKAPALPVGMKQWEVMAAKLTHLGFYILMLVVPLLGWAAVSSSKYAGSIPTEIFGIIPWPHVPGLPGLENRAVFHGIFEEMHKILAYATFGLFLLHVVAAMKHQFISKDGVLGRMIPFVR